MSANSDRPIRGAVYARFSTHFQSSTDDQVRECLKWARENNIEVPDEFVFVDEAKTGRSSRRDGLDRMRQGLAQKQFDVVIVFATNRLFRKMYKALQFVEEEIVERGIRCVFIKSNVDTADKERWRQMLSIHGMMDEHLSGSIVGHIRAGHEGLFRQRKVFGTITFGYGGEEIPGEETRRGRPSRKLVIDPDNAEWVRRIFSWFVDADMPCADIARRLSREGAPLPPRCSSGTWTRNAVHGLLSNERYRGLWAYGEKEAVWLNSKDYSRQIPRDKPLMEEQIEDLRIIDDRLWFAAQKRLADFRAGSGHKPKDGNQKSRPKILNRLLYCAEHDRPLQVAGTDGKYMICRQCKHKPEPYLYSQLPRQRALQMVCQEISTLVTGCDDLVRSIAERCRLTVQEMDQPSANTVEQLNRQLQRINGQVQFILDAPGETDEDRSESRQRLQQCRQQRAEIQAERARTEGLKNLPVHLPTEEDIRQMLEELSAILINASTSDDPREIAAARSIIETVTGGRIAVTQCGERQRQRGWLRLEFDVDLSSYIADTTNMMAEAHDPVHVVIDLKKPSGPPQEDVDRSWELYRQGCLGIEIAEQLGFSRAKVSNLLKIARERYGCPAEDGRKRRKGLQRKQTKTPDYIARADEAKRLWWDELLSAKRASRELGCSDAQVMKSVRYWYESRGLSPPSGQDHVLEIIRRAMEMFESGQWQIKQIAERFDYSPRGMTLLLQKAYKDAGKTMPMAEPAAGDLRVQRVEHVRIRGVEGPTKS